MPTLFLLFLVITCEVIKEGQKVVNGNAHLSSLARNSIDKRGRHKLVKRPDIKCFSQIACMLVVTVKVLGFGVVFLFGLGLDSFFVTMLRHTYIVQLVCMQLYSDITQNILWQM